MDIQYINSAGDNIEKEEDIIINGENVGSMKTRRYDRGEIYYHAVINIPNSYHSLIQGFGPSKKEAIQNAIVKGRLEAEQLLSGVDNFAHKLGMS